MPQKERGATRPTETNQTPIKNQKSKYTLSAVRRTNMTRTTERNTDLHSRLDEFPQDGGGAQAEPWAGVRRARSQQRTPRTGSLESRLALPTQENEASRPQNDNWPVLLEAEDSLDQRRHSHIGNARSSSC
jgi:hypothetical protein